MIEALALGAPLLVLGLVVLLGRLEAWTLKGANRRRHR